MPDAQNLPQLNSAVAECITAMSVDVLLQQNMFKQGVLFHLVQYLFSYDYTLEEGGVEKSSQSNQQVLVVLTPPIHSCVVVQVCGSRALHRRWRTGWRCCARARARRSAA